MRRNGSIFGLICLCIVLLGTGLVHRQSTGSIAGWGSRVVVEPSALDSLVTVDGGGFHSLGLKSDGSIVAWGYSIYGQCNVPAPNEGFMAIAAGSNNSLGLKADNPTAVAFSCIAAESREGSIVLHWETEADEAVNGFRLYRALRPGDFSCITDSPLSLYTNTYEDRAIEPGKEYRYVVAALTLDGREIRSLEVTAFSIAPPLALYQNVPNPFNPRTTIGFSLPRSEQVRIDIYDLVGRLVRRLVDRPMEAGRHQIVWNGWDDRGRTVASGVYFYQMTAGKQSPAKKMILLR